MPINPLYTTFDVSYSDHENMYEYENEELLYKYENKEKSPLVNQQNMKNFKKWFLLLSLNLRKELFGHHIFIFIFFNHF